MRTDAIKFLTLQETTRLFHRLASYRREKAIFLLAYRHGLRASEVGMLRIEDIDFKTLRIMIHRLKGSHSGDHVHVSCVTSHPPVHTYTGRFDVRMRSRNHTTDEAAFPVSEVQGPDRLFLFGLSALFYGQFDCAGIIEVWLLFFWERIISGPVV